MFVSKTKLILLRSDLQNSVSFSTNKSCIYLNCTFLHYQFDRFVWFMNKNLFVNKTILVNICILLIEKSAFQLQNS